MNWYVIQVKSGYEHKIAEKCEILISSKILHECFIPEYICRKKYQGIWQDVKDVLFPGYIFMITDHIEELNVELRKVPDFTKILGKKETEIYPLEEKEVMFLETFGKEEHLVEMSIGFIQGDKIHVTQGPLQGKEGMITKIDRHKRIAYIQLSMFNKETTAKVGLEIISKC